MTATTFERLSAALSDRYRLEREIGAGGMATVYLAEDLRHHRRVALKVLKPELTEVLGAERFLKEIEVTANLHHPHILPLFDSGEVRTEHPSSGGVEHSSPSFLALASRLTSWMVTPPRFARVAMLALANRTGDSTQNYIVDGLTESVIADLARLEHVDVISLASVLGYRTAPKPVDSIARALGVDAVVAGSAQRHDEAQ